MTPFDDTKRRWGVVVAPLLALFAGGCPAAEYELSVELRTDFVAGTDFIATRAELFGAAPDETTEPRARVDAPAFGSFTTPQRIGAFTVEPGRYFVRAQLLSDEGDLVAEAVSERMVSASEAVQLVVMRSCLGVRCEAGMTCVAGGCVPVSCPTCRTDAGTEVDGGGPDAGETIDGGPPPCTPDCMGHTCGADPVCGTMDCGACGAGQSCSGGSCVDDPPDCSGLSCGPARNGIGGADACGTCGSGFTCADGACACGGNGAACVSGSCCSPLACAGGACCTPVQMACGSVSECCPGRACQMGICCVVIGDGCSSDEQCCNGHNCDAGRCCVRVGMGCSSDGQCCTNDCFMGACR